MAKDFIKKDKATDKPNENNLVKVEKVERKRIKITRISQLKKGDVFTFRSNRFCRFKFVELNKERGFVYSNAGDETKIYSVKRNEYIIKKENKFKN